MKLSEVYRTNAKMLLYGASGVGKTYLASRLPNVLYLDIEGGLSSGPDDLEWFPVAELPAVFRKSRDEYPSVATKVESMTDLDGLYRLCRANPGRFDTLVLDSVTEAQKRVHDYITSKFSRAVTQKFVTDAGEEENFNVLSQQGWQALQNKVKAGFRQFRDLPMNVLFICLEEVGTSDDGSMTCQPLLDGRKNLPDLQAIVDYGIRLTQTVVKTGTGLTTRRLFCCQKTPTLWAKSRGGLLAETEPVTEAGLNALLLKIQGGDPGKHLIASVATAPASETSKS